MANQRRVLVVGGGSGIGVHVTRSLLLDHGAKVVVLGLDLGPELLELGNNPDLCVLQGDATKSSLHDECYETVSRHLGGLDAVVTTLGTLQPIELLATIDIEALRRAFEVNVFAPVKLIQRMLPLLRQSKGRIIILSSRCDKTTMYSGWSAYCMSKASLSRFIEALGHEEEEVQVCGIYPGLTKTPMVDAVLENKYEGTMKASEVIKYKTMSEDGTMELPNLCGQAVARLAAVVNVKVPQGAVVPYPEIDRSLFKL